MEQGMSRRGFIRTSAAAAVGATAVLEAGPALASEAVDYTLVLDEVGEPTETVKADVCVVGAGGTGLAGAMRAAQLGLDVVLLEKNAMPGGSFVCTEGMAAVGSHWQKEAGVELEADDLISRLMDYHHWVPDHALYETLMGESAASIDWLESLDCNFQQVKAFGDSECTCHIYAGDPAKGLGGQFIESMVGAAEKLGVTPRCNMPAKRLLVEDGAVCGVIADDGEGNVLEVDCPVVIIATGGYGNNPDMMGQLTGMDGANVVPSGMPGHDGDGIRMARSAGAQLSWDAGVVNFYGNHLYGTTYGTHVNAACSLQPVLWVNEKAQRYVNEDMFGRNFPYCGMARKRQKTVFTIMDQAILDLFTNEGTLIEVGAAAPTGTPYTSLPDDIQSLIDEGNPHVIVAQSLEELAQKANLDPAALEETIREYNGFCDAGVDTQFKKAPEFLLPIQTPPFYGFEVGNGFFATVGGIRVSPKAEALDENDNPIPGLYVCGMDSSGFYGDCYDAGIAPGSTAQWAVTSARLAAENAKEYLGL